MYGGHSMLCPYNNREMDYGIQGVIDLKETEIMNRSKHTVFKGDGDEPVG
jgi:hypothetical protein